MQPGLGLGCETKPGSLAENSGKELFRCVLGAAVNTAATASMSMAIKVLPTRPLSQLPGGGQDAGRCGAVQY